MFIGANVANNQPVATKYLYHAKKAGTKIAVVNPYREPGMERYWVPSNVESALFGTKIADRYFLINVGGDIGFLNGALKHMIERGLVDRAFIDDHTDGLRPSSPRRSTGSPGRSWRPSPAPRGQRWRSSPPCSAGPAPRCWSGAWASPSTSTARTTSGRSSTSA